VLATDAEALAGTSSTLAVTPESLGWQTADGGVIYGTGCATWTANTSGTGATASQATGYSKQVGAPTSVAGYASLLLALRSHKSGENQQSGINFSKPIWFGGKAAKPVVGTTDANSICRITLGKSQLATVTFTDPTDRAIGISYASGNLDLLVHDGTTLTRVNSTHPVVFGTVFDWLIYSAGDGTVILWVNSGSGYSQVASTSAGPSTKSSVSFMCGVQAEAENTATLTGNRNVMDFANIFVRFVL
jgi:hypothetical protein